MYFFYHDIVCLVSHPLSGGYVDILAVFGCGALAAAFLFISSNRSSVTSSGICSLVFTELALLLSMHSWTYCCLCRVCLIVVHAEVV